MGAVFWKVSVQTILVWASSGMLLSKRLRSVSIRKQKNVTQEKKDTVLQRRCKYVFILLSKESKQNP